MHDIINQPVPSMLICIACFAYLMDMWSTPVNKAFNRHPIVKVGVLGLIYYCAEFNMLVALCLAMVFLKYISTNQMTKASGP